jgi:hypothetical protein
LDKKKLTSKPEKLTITAPGERAPVTIEDVFRWVQALQAEVRRYADADSATQHVYYKGLGNVEQRLISLELKIEALTQKTRKAHAKEE